MPVTPLPETTGPPAYASQADLEGYIEGWVTTDPAALERLLERAERDIDTLLGDYDRQPGTDRKLDPAALTTHQAYALRRATCAQAEYRIAMGEEFFVQAQYTYVSGPDFSRRGELPRIGPKVLGELADCGFRMAVPIATI
ncbi:MAG: hypothetical protein WKF96_17285 [Solirubrobacteraceae bacterium]